MGLPVNAIHNCNAIVAIAYLTIAGGIMLNCSTVFVLCFPDLTLDVFYVNRILFQFVDLFQHVLASVQLNSRPLPSSIVLSYFARVHGSIFFGFPFHHEINPTKNHTLVMDTIIFYYTKYFISYVLLCNYDIVHMANNNYP